MVHFPTIAAMLLASAALLILMRDLKTFSKMDFENA